MWHEPAANVAASPESFSGLWAGVIAFFAALIAAVVVRLPPFTKVGRLEHRIRRDAELHDKLPEGPGKVKLAILIEAETTEYVESRAVQRLGWSPSPTWRLRYLSTVLALIVLFVALGWMRLIPSPFSQPPKDWSSLLNDVLLPVVVGACIPFAVGGLGDRLQARRHKTARPVSPGNPASEAGCTLAGDEIP